MTDILVEVDIEETPIEIEIVEAVVEVYVDEISVEVVTTGEPGRPGRPGDDGPPGPTAVSADEGNIAVLGSDSLIYVPLAFDEATLDARYVNGAGDTIPGLMSLLTSPEVTGPAGAANMVFRFADQPSTYLNQIVNRFSGNPWEHAMEFWLRWNNTDQMLMSLRADGIIVFNGVPQFNRSGANQFVGTLTVLSDVADAAALKIALAADARFHGAFRGSFSGAWMTSNIIRFVMGQGIDGIEREVWRAIADGSMSMTGPVIIGPGGTPGTIPLIVNGIAGQTANLLEVRNDAGVVMFYVAAGGHTYSKNAFNASIVRVPGIDLWNDGTIYFQAQAVSLGSVPGALRSNSPLLLPGAPTDPLHAATMQFVLDTVANSTPTLPPESDASGNTAYGVSAQLGEIGNSNTAIGTYAQAAATGPATSMNDAIGSYSQYNLNGAQGNMAMGRSAQYDLVNGMYNVGIGYGAQAIAPSAKLIGASEQVAIGFCSGPSDVGTGDGATSVGARAVAHTKAVALGHNAQAKGVNAVALGKDAVSMFDGSVAIGARADGTLSAATTKQNQIELGTPAHEVHVPGVLKADNNINLPGGGLLWTATDRFLYVKDGWLSSANGMAVLQPFQIGEGTEPTHAATKQYVDSRIWSGTQAEYDAIPAKDPAVLYVVI